MLLIDRILSEPVPEQLPNDMRQDLEMSAKFVVEESFAVAADAIIDKEYDKIKDTVRPPYKVTWLETLHASRTHFRHGRPVQEYEVDPVRVGVLIRTISDDMRTTQWALFWDNKQYAPDASWTTSALTMLIDPDGEIADKSIAKGTGRRITFTVKDQLPVNVVMIPNNAILNTLSLINNSEITNFIAERSAYDWAGEIQYWSCVLALLGVKNVTTTVPGEPRERLNKARAKRGKLPLYEYRVCKLMLGREHRQSGAGATSAHDIRMHFVRGHFKVRKTGTFWWTPHKRGNKLIGRVEKDYVASARAIR